MGLVFVSLLVLGMLVFGVAFRLRELADFRDPWRDFLGILATLDMVWVA